MSLQRLIYYSAMISAWAAFLGWGVSEWITSAAKVDPAVTSRAAGVFLRFMLMAATAGTIGAAIGLGLNVLGGMANGQWLQLIRRALPGLLCGCAGGVAGGLVGGVMYYFDLPRAIGWAVFGLGVGCAEGVYDRSWRKIRNGLAGGGVGGLIGGLLFNSICDLKLTESGAASRAAGFVVLGLSIGTAIGLAHFVFRAAWLTVVDGYRTGRQLNLTQPLTVLGRGDHVAMPFLGPTNKDLDAEHALIRRMPDGSYSLEDNRTRLGTRLNGLAVTGSVPLNDGDVIRVGTNLVRFDERRGRRGEPVPHPAAPVSGGASIPLPPPPPTQSSADKVFAPEPRPWIGTKPGTRRQ
jgi:hypothetical protein